MPVHAGTNSPRPHRHRARELYRWGSLFVAAAIAEGPKRVLCGYGTVGVVNGCCAPCVLRADARGAGHQTSVTMGSALLEAEALLDSGARLILSLRSHVGERRGGYEPGHTTASHLISSIVWGISIVPRAVVPTGVSVGR